MFRSPLKKVVHLKFVVINPILNNSHKVEFITCLFSFIIFFFPKADTGNLCQFMMTFELYITFTYLS